jgi:hypothetical protein
VSTLVVTNLSLGAGGLPDGSVLTSDIADGAITGPKIAAGAVSAVHLDGNQSGSAPIFGARAWVNFDGTGTFSPNPSTTKIRASGNVTSITDNGTGSYSVNFTTPMPDTNYAVSGTASLGANYAILRPSTTFSTGSVDISTVTQNGGNPTAFDPSIVSVIITR